MILKFKQNCVTLSRSESGSTILSTQKFIDFTQWNIDLMWKALHFLFIIICGTYLLNSWLYCNIVASSVQHIVYKRDLNLIFRCLGNGFKGCNALDSCKYVNCKAGDIFFYVDWKK